MHLVSILGGNRQFLQRGASGGIDAAGGAPDLAHEFLLEPVDRSDGSLLQAGDRFVIRHTATDDVWRFGYYESDTVDRSQPTPRPSRATAFPLRDPRFPTPSGAPFPEVIGGHVTAERPVADAPTFLQTFLVTAVEGRFDPARGLPVRLAVVLPTEWLEHLPSWWTEWLTGSDAAVQRWLRPVFGTSAFLGHLSLDPSGNVVATPVPQVGEPGVFRVLPHSPRAFLVVPDGRVVAVDRDSEGLVLREPTGLLDSFSFTSIRHPFSGRLFPGDEVVLRAATGHVLTTGEAGDDLTLSAGADAGLVFTVDRPGASRSPIADDDVVNLTTVVGGGRDALGGSEPRLVLRVAGTGAGASVGLAPAAATHESAFTLRLTRDLSLYWNGRDNASSCDPIDGYRLVRPQVRVHLAPVAGSVALKRFSNSRVGDRTTVATQSAAGRARTDGYVFEQVEGYVSRDSLPGTVPLKLYASTGPAPARDHFTAATVDDERSVHRYRFVSVEAYATEVRPRPAPDAGRTVRRTPGAPVVAPPPGSARVVPNAGVRAASAVGAVGVVGGPRARRPVRALVLSGGGAKGCFEAGALQYLWNERGYRPDIICGVSAGAVNAAKLAEGTDGAADDLVELWIGNASEPDRIFLRNHFPAVLLKLVERTVEAAGDTAEAGLAGTLGGAVLGAVLGPAVSIAVGAAAGATAGGAVPGVIGAMFGSGVPGPAAGFVGGGATGLVVGAALADLDARALRTLNFGLTLLHSFHSMQPFRDRIREELDVAAIRRSGIDLRVGVTDVKSGQYFTVSGPRTATGPLADSGVLTREPDHHVGESWLSRPLFGADGYAMALRDAIYASSALPVYMEPMVVDLRGCHLVEADGSTYARFPSRPESTALAPGLEELLEATARPHPDWDHVERVIDRILEGPDFVESTPHALDGPARFDAVGDRGPASAFRYLFDGGLRDTLPVRTAMRLGADEIIVVTGDRLQQSHHQYSLLRKAPQGGIVTDYMLGDAMSSVDVFSTPLFQHLGALLGTWFNDAARNDMLLALARNEYVGWLRRAAGRLPDDARAALRRELEAYRDALDPARYEELGSAGWVGAGESTAGDPLLAAKPARISYIAPDRDIVGPLDFDNERAVRDGIALGYQAAQHPVVVSDPGD